MFGCAFVGRTMSSSNMTTSTIGFPRIGPNREMKKALERFACVGVLDLVSPRRILSIFATGMLRAVNEEDLPSAATGRSS